MAREKNVPGGTGMLLLSLLSGGEMYGYQMITALRERSNHVFDLKAGTLYPLLHTLEAQGYEVVNTLFTDEWYSRESMEARGVVQIPLCFLAKSLENMSLCHAAYFCKGWEKARGCRIEHEAAVAYGLTILYEE